jgi:galactofuranosylgalactofuranosylrhamnosyl-N-acetylglucosaminyl-diphospho-decaprenol beta-1,5/1,6-galactofuranosyltransferase
MLTVKLGELRDIRAEYVDAQIVEDLSSLPPVRRSSVSLAGPSTRPTNPLSAIMLALRVGGRQLLIPETVGSSKNPERLVPAQDIAWWRFADIDSALVTSPDGGGVSWYQRRRRTMVSMLIRSARTYLKLAVRWPELSRGYIDSVGAITSPQAWDEIFAGAQTVGAPPRS